MNNDSKSSDFFASYLDRLESLNRHFRQAVEDLPAEAMDWEPGQEMNSMAVLLAHTAGSLRYWIGDVALGEPSGRVREEEFKTRGVAGKEMLRRIDDAVAYARTALPRLRLEDLADEVPADDEVVTKAWALLHALEHAYLHLGHIQLTTQLWKERSLTG